MRALLISLLMCWGLALPLHALAQVQAQPTPAGLPDTAQAAAWLERDPMVLQAQAALGSAGHGAAALAASSHEWLLKASGQRRRVRELGSSQEWSLGLERTLRLGGKAALDRRLGELDQDIARARLGEARHEAARALAELWLDWQAASAAQALAQQQLALGEANLQVVGKRLRAGDAARLEQGLARSELAELQRQRSAATSRLALARLRLQRRFAELPAHLPVEAPVLADPAAIATPALDWAPRILAESDLLRTAEGLLQRAELEAARARADKRPDPTLGLYTASEAFRNERVVGISLSLPLGGAYREARLQQALAEVEVARAALAREREALELELAGGVAEWDEALTRWQLAAQAAGLAGESAAMLQKAYALGEGELQALLLARRQWLEAQRAEQEARVQALRARHRLLIDAHLIWGLEHD